MRTPAIDPSQNTPRKNAAKRAATIVTGVALVAAAYFSPEIRSKVSRKGGSKIAKGILKALDYVADKATIFRKSLARKFSALKNS